MAALRATATMGAMLVFGLATVGGWPAASAFCIPDPVSHECLPDPQDVVQPVIDEVEERLEPRPAEECGSFPAGLRTEDTCGLIVFLCGDAHWTDCPQEMADPAVDVVTGQIDACLEEGASPCEETSCLYKWSSVQCLPVPPLGLPDVEWEVGSVIQGVDTVGNGEIVAVMDDVLVTLPGRQPQTLVGVGSSDPCEVWLAIPGAACTPNALIARTELRRPSENPVMCLYNAVFKVDVNGDGEWDYYPEAILLLACP